MSNITRWNPVREMIALRDAMDQVFNDRIFRTMDGRTFGVPMDAYMTDDALILTAEVPGLKPEDISVTYEGDTLIIRGEFKREENEGKTWVLRERAAGKFERTLTINTPIDAAKIEAEFENGVLTLKLPKAEAAKPKQITVKPRFGRH